jgi:hypothetical protein
MAIFMGIQPLPGRLSDWIGRRPSLLYSGIGWVIATVPLLSILSGTRNPVVAFVLMTADGRPEEVRRRIALLLVRLGVHPDLAGRVLDNAGDLQVVGVGEDHVKDECRAGVTRRG